MTRVSVRLRLHGLLTVLLIALAVVAAGSSSPGATTRVSIASAPGNAQANSDSSSASISANGRYVAFASAASNLAPADTNGVTDAFVRDLQTGITTRVSISTAGTEANAESSEPEISGDGSAVVFASRASNLVPGDTNGASDIFVRDLTTGITSRVDLTLAGGETNFGSVAPSISSSGRYVAYSSSANNIFPGDVNAGADIFVFDRTTSTTQLVSISTAGGLSGFGEENNNPGISGDGRSVAFESGSSTFDAADTNGKRDIYVRDITASTTTRVSRTTAGGLADGNSFNAKVSANGNWVAYSSDATNLVAGDTNSDRDVFITSTSTLAAELVSKSTAGVIGNSGSDGPSVNTDGSYVTYDSAASNLVAGDTNNVTDVFVRNRATAVTTRESLSNDGLQSNTASTRADLTGDGQNVIFQSFASDLVAGDTNNRSDIFVHQLGVADHQPPVVTGTPDRPANADGWYKANVTITWTSIDPPPSSGAPTQPSATLAATEGQSVVYTSAPSCDLNLNCATGSLPLSIDKTLPTITASLPAANANGWYRQAVVVGFTCADALSGVVSCAAPVTLSSDGAGQSAMGTAQDRAGNVATTTVTGIKIDQTAPTITFTGNLGTYTSAQTISITCSATDATSGIDTQTCPSLSTPASLLIPGPHTLTATATDKAGNTTTATATFTVVSNRLMPVAQLACSYLTPGHNNDELCAKLIKIAAKADAAATAGDSDKAYQGLSEFIHTVQDASAKNFTRQQAGLLTALAAFVTY